MYRNLIVSAIFASGSVLTLLHARMEQTPPASLYPDVVAVRATYPGANLSPAQLGELLNKVAWEHRADGWGLLSKPGGNNCPAPTGVPVGCDILFHRPSGLHYDVLGDAEGRAVPAWSADGPMDVSRWVAPVDPGSQPVPVSTPTPTPIPLPDDSAKRIAALEAAVTVLSQRLDALPPPTNTVDDAHIQALISSAFTHATVYGRTGQTLGHSHGVNLTLTVKQ